MDTSTYEKAYLLTHIGYFETTRVVTRVLYPQGEDTDVNVVFYQEDNGIIKFLGSDGTWKEDERGYLQPITAGASPMTFNTCEDDFHTWDKIASIFTECER